LGKRHTIRDYSQTSEKKKKEWVGGGSDLQMSKKAFTYIVEYAIPAPNGFDDLGCIHQRPEGRRHTFIERLVGIFHLKGETVEQNV
jgi:hypothetical protein